MKVLLAVWWDIVAKVRWCGRKTEGEKTNVLYRVRTNMTVMNEVVR